jgi:hypothetical protein
MARTWLSIRVELVEGRGEPVWPRPGRLFAAARGHSFAALGTAIDDAFGRWDRAHLHKFRLADGTRLTTPTADRAGDRDAHDLISGFLGGFLGLVVHLRGSRVSVG